MKRRTITPQERRKVYTRDAGTCQICGRQLQFEEMTIDHIMPLASGGTNQISNFQCSCYSCNQFKSNFIPREFYDMITEIYWYQVEKKCGSDFTEKMNKFLLEL